MVHKIKSRTLILVKWLFHFRETDVRRLTKSLKLFNHSQPDSNCKVKTATTTTATTTTTNVERVVQRETVQF